MLRLKQLEDRYLHELFKAVLLYNAPEVKKILAMKIGGKLMKEWKLEDRTHQEISPTSKWERYNGNIDVIWYLSKIKFYEKERICQRVILHEVKTGKYDIVGVIKKYRRSHYSPMGNFEQGFRATTRDAPLYIWAWKKYQFLNKQRSKTIKPPEGLVKWFDPDSDNDVIVDMLIKRGGVRLLPLDWLLPILEERMSEVFEWEN